MKYRYALLALLLPGLALALWLWWRDGQPRPVVDVAGGQLDCVSYSPAIRTGDPDAVIDRERLVHDLTLLAKRFRCVRTYSVSEGLSEVPSIARELKLKLLMGLWIGRDSLRNQREIRNGLELAKEYHDVIEGIVVGNEVLLRRELTAGRLAELIAQVDEGTDLPVTYADVWDFWKENPGLAPVVSFVTIHLLPYWENNPTNIEAAIRHVAQVYDEARTIFPDKPIVIGETGWPSRGRQREDAAPSLVNEARFIREFTHWAHDQGVKYNLIEAFDQPWKRQQEGTVGGYWGIFDRHGTPKFELTGPVVENPRWQRGWYAAAVGAGLLLLAGLVSSRRRHLAGLAVLALAGALAGAVAMFQYRYAEASARSTTEWVALGLLALVGWGITLRAVLAAAGREAEAPVPGGLAEILGSLGLGVGKLQGRERRLGLLRFALLGALAFHVLGLAFDPRYRDFPLSYYALPSLALLVISLTMRRERAPRLALVAEEATLAIIVAAAAVGMAIREGYLNGPALAFAALSGAAALSVFGASRRLAADHQGGQQHADHG